MRGGLTRHHAEPCNPNDAPACITQPWSDGYNHCNAIYIHCVIAVWRGYGRVRCKATALLQTASHPRTSEPAAILGVGVSNFTCASQQLCKERVARLVRCFTINSKVTLRHISDIAGGLGIKIIGTEVG